MKLIEITDRPKLKDTTCFGYREIKITCDDELADEIESFILRLCFDDKEKKKEAE